jgi:hypothetical protein
MGRRCWDRNRTRPTGVYAPLDRTTRTALPACTCLDPQPLARDPAGAGGVAWANQGLIGLKAETTAEPSRNGQGPRFGCIGKYRYIRSLPMSRWDLMPWTGDVAGGRRWKIGAGRHRGSPQPESWTGGGAARVRTQRAGVYALLNWDSLSGCATRLLRLE